MKDNTTTGSEQEATAETIYERYPEIVDTLAASDNTVGAVARAIRRVGGEERDE